LSSAAEQYSQAIRLKPGLADAHCSLGNLLGAQQKYEKAKVELQACTQLDPSRVEANLGLGLVSWVRGRNSGSG
jgi:Tfp pilus assembly protein PilF